MDLFRGLSGKFLIPYALTIIFGVWTYYTLQKVRGYQDVKESLLQVKTKLLEIRKHEKDFLAREYKNVEFLTTGNSQYARQLNEIVDQLHLQFERYRTNHAVSEAEVDSIHVLLSNYQESFNTLSSLIKSKGFKDHGLTGKLRTAIHEVEDAQLAYDKAYMLMLRRHEKDFFLRHDLSYWKKFEQGVEDFKRHINLVGQKYPLQRDEILAKIDEYQIDFSRVVEIQVEIGLNENLGHHGQLRQAIHDLTPYVDTLIANHSTYLDRSIERNNWALLVLFIVILAIGVVILAYHISKITRNINLIRENSMLLAKGLFPAKQKVNSRDELGQAHRALNELTEGLRAKTQFAKEIGEGRLDAFLETQSKDDILGYSLIKMRDNLSMTINDINTTIKEAGEEGNLSSRISLENKERFWKTFSSSINRLLEAFSTPVYKVDMIVKAMAQGDLTLRYDLEARGGIKTLANNLNLALDNLNDFLNQIAINARVVEESSNEMNNSSQEMNASMGEIATTTSEMSKGANAQVEKVDESSNLMESILRSFHEMSQKSESIHNTAISGVENSNSGKSMVEDVVNNISAISEYSKDTSKAILQLKTQSKEISRVLGLINEIASQTNLLALNASIEAAQAGDAGRGFAVVAEEIRKLADQSRNSVREIEKLVTDVQNGTITVAGSIDKMTNSVLSVEDKSRNAQQVFQRMSGSSNETLALSKEILQLTHEKRNEMNLIAKLTEGVVVIAEQTAAGTEELASSTAQINAGMNTFQSKTKRLSVVASTLNAEVRKFNLTENMLENMGLENHKPIDEQKNGELLANQDH